MRAKPRQESTEQVVVDAMLHVGRAIARLRQAHGLTQQHLSDLLDVTRVYVSLLESGARRPSFELLAKLAHVFSEILADPRTPIAQEMAVIAAFRELEPEMRARTVDMLRALGRQR